MKSNMANLNTSTRSVRLAPTASTTAINDPTAWFPLKARIPRRALNDPSRYIPQTPASSSPMNTHDDVTMTRSIRL